MWNIRIHGFLKRCRPRLRSYGPDERLVFSEGCVSASSRRAGKGAKSEKDRGDLVYFLLSWRPCQPCKDLRVCWPLLGIFLSGYVVLVPCSSSSAWSREVNILPGTEGNYFFFLEVVWLDEIRETRLRLSAIFLESCSWRCIIAP